MGRADVIVADLRAWIDQAAPGARLPASRELAARYAASPVTVQAAMRSLVSQGLVESRPGAGTFVLDHRSPRAADFGWQTSALRTAASSRLGHVSGPMRDATVDVIGLHAGYPTRELLPERLVRVALSRASRSEAAFARPPIGGLPELQGWFASELASSTPAGVSPPTTRDVLVVPGTQSALSSVFRSLAGAAHAVLMESPTYWGALLAARQAGVHVVPVRDDTEGPDPSDLARAFDESGARIFYAQPTFANPTGAQWSPERREQVLAVVKDAGAFLVEDDWAADFAIDADPVPVASRDETGHVIYIRSLTKSVSPAIRVGAIIARGPVRERLLVDRVAESMYVSGLLQAAALDVVLQPAWRTHLRRLRGQLRERRDLLAHSVAEQLPDATMTRLPRGGLNLWVRLPDHVDLERLVKDCEAEGVLIAAGTEWFPADPTGQFVRLNFAGPDPSRFPHAARVLGTAVRAQ